MARKFEFRVGQGQSIYDLAVQFYGDVSKAVEIVRINDNLESLEDPVAGKTLIIEVQEEEVPKALRAIGRNISTT